jgi:hypothetical protein
MESPAPVTPYAVCVIGNSHSAAFAKAWTERVEPGLPGVSMTFFAASSQRLRHLVHEDGALTTHEPELAEALAAASGGKTRIEIAAYDAFLLVGLGMRITVPSLCGPFGTIGHRSWGPVETLVSEACFGAMVEAALQESQAFGLIDQIRAAGPRPALLCATPFRSDEEASYSFRNRNRRFADDTFRGKVIAQCQQIGSALAARHGGEFVWQDESTISMPGFTKAEFARGAHRLAESEMDDGLHMNMDFGQIMLTRALGRLDEISGGAVLGPARALKRA